MTNTEHPALVALREIKSVHRQVFRYGLNRNSAVAAMHEAADRALPALEALIAERDALREVLSDLLEWQQPSTMPTLADLKYVDDGKASAVDCGGHVRAVVRARAALAKGE